MAKPTDGHDFAQRLLAWYDRHARTLPWRIPPHDPTLPDPYRVWLSEIMLQQTTTTVVADYYARFLARWPRVQDLAAADDGDVMEQWAGLGYYARARNLLACAREVARLGAFPDTHAGLLALPGIGPYTAAAIAAIAFGRAEAVVDGNVERVLSRHDRIAASGPALKEAVRAALQPRVPTSRPGDFAQGLMDLGAMICTPRNPTCALCPLNDTCQALAAGEVLAFPIKALRKDKPVRRGAAFVAVFNDGSFLVERRPPRGLLGGMLAFPSPAWEVAPLPSQPPFAAEWREIGEVRHTFTHFHLILTVMRAELPGGSALPQGLLRETRRATLPGLMRKVHDLALKGQ